MAILATVSSTYEGKKDQTTKYDTTHLDPCNECMLTRSYTSVILRDVPKIELFPIL